MRNLTFRLLLCFLLVIEAVASPITYPQVVPQSKPPAQPQTTAPQSNPAPDAQIPITESGDRPEFVRLADGRIVPFGAGVICSDECIPAEAFAPDDPPGLREVVAGGSRWRWVLPLLAGGFIPLALLRGGDDDDRIIVTPEPPRVVEPPIPAEVPEPATLMLLGLGLAMMARHGFGKKKSDDQ